MSFVSDLWDDAVAELTGGKTSTQKQYEASTGQQLVSFTAPPVFGAGKGAASVATKMFGTSKKVASVPKAASSFPTWLKVAGAGAGVGLAGLGISSLGTKKEMAGAGGAGGSDYSNRSVYSPTTTTTTTNTITNTYSTLNQNDYSTQSILSSPGASISTKKEAAASATATPTVTPRVDVAPAIDTSGGGGGAGGTGGSTGTDMTMLAIIIGIALVGHGYLSSRKSKRR